MHKVIFCVLHPLHLYWLIKDLIKFSKKGEDAVLQKNVDDSVGSQRGFKRSLQLMNIMLFIILQWLSLLSSHLNNKNKYFWIKFINIFLLLQHFTKHFKNLFF